MQERSLVFCTVFPNYRDFHFYKDPGQIPYRFSLRGYDTSVVCYGRSGDYPETERHLKVIAIPDRYTSRKFSAGIAWYLVRHARSIDILNIFHYSWSSLLFSFIYKTFNRRGFAYLKLDDCIYARRDNSAPEEHRDAALRLGGAGLKSRLRRYIARRYMEGRIDLWSIEDEESRSILEAENPFLRGKLITVYNGHTADLAGAPSFRGFRQKEDIILTAGRLGTFQKATDVILDAFRFIAGSSGYQLHLAGEVEPAFRPFVEQFYREFPELADRVIFHGSLRRNELFELYNRSRIFCLPSRFEGMAVVLPEAMHYGNAIVTTADGSLRPLIEAGKFGLVVERDDSRALADALLKLITDRGMTERMAEEARRISSGLLSWDRITDVLTVAIRERKGL